MNDKIMKTIRNLIFDEIFLAVKGHIQCWYRNDSIFINIRKSGTTFQYEINDVLSLILNGKSAKELSDLILQEYRKDILNKFFNK